MAKTTAELIALHEELCAEARTIMQAKNHDYSGPKDIFRNFRKHGRLGILVRMDDKLARLETFVERGDLAVSDESIRDTVADLINYAVLYLGYE